MAGRRSNGLLVFRVVTFLLVVVPTLGCQPWSQEAVTRASETPTWANLGARRLFLTDPGRPRTSPDGRFVYSFAVDDSDSPILVRFDTAVEYGAEAFSDLDVVRREPDWVGNRPTPPVVSSDGTRIAFGVIAPGESPRAFAREIRIVEADTGADLQVVGGEAVGTPLAWLPDGRGLVTRTVEGLVSVSLVDESRRLLVPTGELASPTSVSVSPDGRFVAYDGVPFEGAAWSDQGICIAAVDGSWRDQVVDAPYVQEAPLWTPDGSVLVYASTQRGDSAIGLQGRWELWGIEMTDGRPVGTPHVLVADGGDWHHAAPSWDRPIGLGLDGTLVFGRSGARSDVYTVPIDPETHELAGEPVSVFGGEGVANRAGTISPDGTLMAFITRRRWPGSPDSWKPAIRDLTTGTDRLLDYWSEQPGGFGSTAMLPPGRRRGVPDSTMEFYMPPTWSPDGRYVLFPLRYSEGTLYVFDVVTGEHGWLLEDEPAGSVSAFGWLPDGHRFVYGANSQTEAGSLLSVHQYDVDRRIEHELWRGPAGTFVSTYSNHLSPDGRYVTLPKGLREGDYTGQALWVLDLELGELRELARSPNAYMSVDEPFWMFNQWTNSGTEIIASGFDNSQWRVNAYPDETTFWAIPLTGGDPRKLGTVQMDLGGEWFGGRYFSLHPKSDALTFTGGGIYEEIWVVPGFGEVLNQWKKAER